VWALDAVSAPERLMPALSLLLDRVAVVQDLPQAAALVAEHPELVAATRGGDVIGAGWASGGSAGRQSVIEIQAAVDEAEEQLAVVTATLADLEAALAGARSEAEARAAEAEASLAALYESDARMSAVAEQLGRLGEAARSAEAEAARLVERRRSAEAAQDEFRRQVADLENRLAAAESDDAPAEIDPAHRDRLAAATAAARQREVEARLALRTAEERARATAGAADNLRRAAKAERESRARAAQALARREAGAVLAGRVATVGSQIAQRLAASVAGAAAARSAAETDRAAAEQRAASARSSAAALQAEWDSLTDSVHSTEVLRAQQRLRLEQLAETAGTEYAMSVDDVVAEYGPDVPVPPSALEMAEYAAARDRGEQVSEPSAMPFDRASTQRRAKRAERDLALLGKVNPLALEEFAAMEERHAFLSTQLEDLRSTRKDLLAVVKEVDEKILQLFTSAYTDVAAEFRTVFAALFPGGEGELVLTDPSDMLATGVDVTARPPGKKVKRLSLLSGGERSLVAVAMLVAIFRARPSPFYVLDEVEAALDEVNLTRLVGLLHELRSSSQLLVITHQKYTMEAADVLYGVSMRGGGISQVISQRIRPRTDGGDRASDGGDGEPADAPEPRPASQHVGT
jgi:chromosome segregation protein